jgi:hypothetical protein
MSSFVLVIIACVNSPMQLEGIWTPMPFLRQERTSNIIVCNHFIIFICNYSPSSSSSSFSLVHYLSVIGSFDLFLTLHIVQGLYKKLYYIVTMKEASSVINTKESYTILD